MNEDEADPLDGVAPWLGRVVRRVDNDEGRVLGDAVVLAVDDTPYAPSAWIKYRVENGRREYPTYRSVDLSDLEDVETGRHGPRWGTGGPEADIAAIKGPATR